MKQGVKVGEDRKLSSSMEQGQSKSHDDNDEIQRAECTNNSNISEATSSQCTSNVNLMEETGGHGMKESDINVNNIDASTVPPVNNDVNKDSFDDFPPVDCDEIDRLIEEHELKKLSPDKATYSCTPFHETMNHSLQVQLRQEESSTDEEKLKDESIIITTDQIDPCGSRSYSNSNSFVYSNGNEQSNESTQIEHSTDDSRQKSICDNGEDTAVQGGRSKTIFGDSSMIELHKSEDELTQLIEESVIEAENRDRMIKKRDGALSGEHSLKRKRKDPFDFCNENGRQTINKSRELHLSERKDSNLFPVNPVHSDINNLISDIPKPPTSKNNGCRASIDSRSRGQDLEGKASDVCPAKPVNGVVNNSLSDTPKPPVSQMNKRFVASVEIGNPAQDYRDSVGILREACPAKPVNGDINITMPDTPKPPVARTNRGRKRSLSGASVEIGGQVLSHSRSNSPMVTGATSIRQVSSSAVASTSSKAGLSIIKNTKLKRLWPDSFVFMKKVRFYR